MKNLKNYKNSKFLEIQGMKILYLILEKEHRKKITIKQSYINV